MIECENWQTIVSNNNRLTSYRQFKSVYKHKLYVNTLSNVKLRRALARLRTSSHSLCIETGRHIGTPQHERICIFCKDNSTVEVIENEFHFVCCCSLYTDLRLKFLPDNIIKHPSQENFNNLMSTVDTTEVRNLAIFVNEAFKIRANK